MRYLQLIAFIAITGCSNVQNTTLTETKEDGSGYTYQLESRTPMFGKSESYNGDINVGIEADGTWFVKTGQAATGMDNTAQIQGLQSVMLPVSALLQLVAQRAIKDSTAIDLAEIDAGVQAKAQEVRTPGYDEISAWAQSLTKAQRKKLATELGGSE